MKQKRLYGLFERQDSKWVRLDDFPLPKDAAVRIWQGELLAPFMGGYSKFPVKGTRELRPLPR